MNKENSSEFMTIFTIGFTKKSAEKFFELLKVNDVAKVIDTRLNNDNQLAGFSKKKDLKDFLKTILNIEYVHKPILAPTEDILKAYKKKMITWREYEIKYLNLISERHIEDLLPPLELDNSCLLCSEAEPNHCHRRLLAEYLKSKWGNLLIKHL